MVRGLFELIRVGCVASNIVQLMGILFQIEELIGWTFGEAPLVGLTMRLVFVFVVDDVALGRTVVGIGVPRAGDGRVFPVRRSVRPAIGDVVANVEKVMIANRRDG